MYSFLLKIKSSNNEYMNDDIIEISNLDWNKSSDIGSGNKSINFGSGAELLMNNKIKESSASKNDINLDDLNVLENELNSLISDDTNSAPPSKYNTKSDLFNTNSNSTSSHNVKFDDTPFVGQYTAENNNPPSTSWDGFSKFNNVPINPDMNVAKEPSLSKEEMLREKFKYLRKLETLEKKGVELSRKYTMETPLLEMQGEYETIMEEKSKSNSIKFQGNMLMALVNGIEFLNNRFDPFDIKIDGWGEQINENVADYDDVFGELYDKYKSRASMAPELKLLFQLGGSAMMVHMTNTMFKSAMPGMDDILRQNPDLMRQFQTAAVNSVSQTNPGFSGFMNGVVGGGGMSNQHSEYSNGPPPPISTQGPNSMPPPSYRPGNNSYAQSQNDDRVQFKENFENEKSARPPKNEQRTEMKGPSDLSQILSRLKTKNINIQEQKQNENINNSSTISLTELKEIQGEGNIPKRSRRRKTSDKNTVSIDI